MSCRLLIAPELLHAGEIEIDGDDHHYLFRVRRLRTGDEITVFDGRGRQATARISQVGADTALLAVSEPVRVSPPQPAIRVLLPLMKGDGFDSCLSKLVELGVTCIVPIRTRRCVVRVPDAKAVARMREFE